MADVPVDVRPVADVLVVNTVLVSVVVLELFIPDEVDESPAEVVIFPDEFIVELIIEEVIMDDEAQVVLEVFVGKTKVVPLELFDEVLFVGVIGAIVEVDEELLLPGFSAITPIAAIAMMITTTTTMAIVDIALFL